MKHKQKLRIARRMMTNDEIKRHVSPFDSKAWQERKMNKETKVRNQIVAARWNKKDKYEDSKTA